MSLTAGLAGAVSPVSAALLRSATRLLAATTLFPMIAAMNQAYCHTPVLAQALLAGLGVKEQGLYLDATVGGGGHSALILAIEGTRVIAIDRDEQALMAAHQRLQAYGDRIQFWHGNFADYDPGDLRFDGIIADLGVSSAQLDQAERGFSFRQEAPLDMRMNQQQTTTAADLINRASEKDLADWFYRYGEERFSRRIARHIVAQRPFQTTTELASAIATVLPRQKVGRSRGTKIHPATRVFQALRIVVNEELTAVEQFIDRVPEWLKPSGRVGIISFHSLEDRIVKHRFREIPSLTVLTRKPIMAQEQERQANLRARSAKLRLAERQS